MNKLNTFSHLRCLTDKAFFQRGIWQILWHAVLCQVEKKSFHEFCMLRPHDWNVRIDIKDYQVFVYILRKGNNFTVVFFCKVHQLSKGLWFPCLLNKILN